MNAPKDAAGNTWKQHLLAVGFRFLCMAVISFAGVVAGSDSPPERPDGSEQSPGVAGLLFVTGVFAAVVFALLASIVHFCLRRRPLKFIVLADALLAAAFIALMAHNGAKLRGQPKPLSDSMFRSLQRWTSGGQINNMRLVHRTASTGPEQCVCQNINQSSHRLASLGSKPVVRGAGTASLVVRLIGWRSLSCVC